jgi:beta-lactamase class A
LIFGSVPEGRTATHDPSSKTYFNTSLGGVVNFSTDGMADILYRLVTNKDQNEGYQKIYDDMKQTVFHERLETPLTKGHVAHKIGSSDAQFNDIGIFEGENPYILTVYTNHVENAADYISRISNAVWQAQQDYK